MEGLRALREDRRALNALMARGPEEPLEPADSLVYVPFADSLQSLNAALAEEPKPASVARIDEIIAVKGLAIVQDTGAIEAAIAGVVEKNPKAVADFKSGKQAAVGALIGQVMKQVKGADPASVREMLIKKLSES